MGTVLTAQNGERSRLLSLLRRCPFPQATRTAKGASRLATRDQDHFPRPEEDAFRGRRRKTHSPNSPRGREKGTHFYADARDAALPPDRINSSFTPCVSRGHALPFTPCTERRRWKTRTARTFAAHSTHPRVRGGEGELAFLPGRVEPRRSRPRAYREYAVTSALLSQFSSAGFLAVSATGRKGRDDLETAIGVVARGRTHARPSVRPFVLPSSGENVCRCSHLHRAGGT